MNVQNAGVFHISWIPNFHARYGDLTIGQRTIFIEVEHSSNLVYHNYLVLRF